MNDPTTTPARSTAFAVDFDRTLTGLDYVPDAHALAAIAELRGAGIRCILATGRSQQDLARFPGIEDAFDAYVLEGGAVWGPWKSLTNTSNVKTALAAADRIAASGAPIERKSSSFSVPLSFLETVRLHAGDCSIQVNVDRIDVLPPGLDKGLGLDGALGSLGMRAAHVIAIGDGENDLPMFARANVALAVANALPAVKDGADEVLAAPGPAAVIDAARRILKGDWRDDGSTVPAAA